MIVQVQGRKKSKKIAASTKYICSGALVLSSSLVVHLLACGFTLIDKVVVSLSHNCLWSIDIVILDADTKFCSLGEFHVPKTETLLAKLRQVVGEGGPARFCINQIPGKAMFVFWLAFPCNISLDHWSEAKQSILLGAIFPLLRSNGSLGERYFSTKTRFQILIILGPLSCVILVSLSGWSPLKSK